MLQLLQQRLSTEKDNLKWTRLGSKHSTLSSSKHPDVDVHQLLLSGDQTAVNKVS